MIDATWDSTETDLAEQILHCMLSSQIKGTRKVLRFSSNTVPLLEVSRWRCNGAGKECGGADRVPGQDRIAALACVIFYLPSWARSTNMDPLGLVPVT